MALTSVAARMAESKRTYSSAQMRSAPRKERPAEAARPANRTYEIAALRRDGSRLITTIKAPALPLFENAFSAFARGTVLQGTQGEVAIEDLQPGDTLWTNSGEPAEVLWIGAATFQPKRMGSERAPLIRVMADAFGQGRPDRFVTLGPGARILHTPPEYRGQTGDMRLLTPARTFVDQDSVIEISPPTHVTLFHIVLDRHAIIRAGGLECESFHPGNSALRSVPHAMRDLFLSMFPQVSHAMDFGLPAFPHAPEPEELRSA